MQNSFYKTKYLKYKQKNNVISKQNGGNNQDIESSLLEQFDIQTYHAMEENEINENISFPNKFFISCHGSMLTHNSLAKILIPNNFTIYFQAEIGTTCQIDSGIDTISRTCYNDEELMSLFKNVSYGTHNATDIKPDFWNKKWLNKHVGGSIINDCLLTGDMYTDEISSVVVHCSNIIGPQILLKISHTQNYLLSQILVKIFKYLQTENIQPPYNIFCSFCLTNDNNYYQQIYNEQFKISQSYPQLYTFNTETPSVEY